MNTQSNLFLYHKMTIVPVSLQPAVCINIFWDKMFQKIFGSFLKEFSKICLEIDNKNKGYDLVLRHENTIKLILRFNSSSFFTFT